MPIFATWLDEQETIKHWQFIDPWEPHDYLAVLPDAISVSSQKPHNIATIMDFSKAQPNRVRAFKLLRIGGKETPKNLEIVIFVGSPFIGSMAAMYRQVNPRIHYEVDSRPTLEEAVQRIQAFRAKPANI